MLFPKCAMAMLPDNLSVASVSCGSSEPRKDAAAAPSMMNRLDWYPKVHKSIPNIQINLKRLRWEGKLSESMLPVLPLLAFLLGGGSGGNDGSVCASSCDENEELGIERCGEELLPLSSSCWYLCSRILDRFIVYFSILYTAATTARSMKHT